MATMLRVYLPGVSFTVRDSQPLKRTVLSPAWPAKASEARGSVHRGLTLLRLLCATHLPLTLRPLLGCVKAKRTVASRSSVYAKVVPTGARRRLICTSCGPPAMRNLACVWLASKTCASAGGNGLTGGGAPPERPGGVTVP